MFTPDTIQCQFRDSELDISDGRPETCWAVYGEVTVNVQIHVTNALCARLGANLLQKVMSL